MADLVRLELGVVFQQEIDGVQWPALLEELAFGSLVNHALGGGTWPSPLNWIMVSDDFEHSTVGFTSSTGSAIGVLLSCMF